MQSTLATTDRTTVIAELTARPLILCSRYTSSRVAGTSSVIVSPCEDGSTVSIWATTGATAIRVIAAGICERRIEIPGDALLKAGKRFNDAEFASAVTGPEGDLSIRLYGEKETLLCRCTETSCGPTDEAITRVMEESLDADCEDRTSMMSRKVLSEALSALIPIAAFRIEPRAKGISVHFEGDDFSGTMLCMGLNSGQ